MTVSPLTRLVQVDAGFHNPSVTPSDSVPLRLLKWFRRCDAAGGGADTPSLVRTAQRAVSILHAAVPGALAGGSTPPRPVQGALQAACEAPLSALAAVLEATAFGWRQQVVAGFGPLSDDPLSGSSSSSEAWRWAS